MQTLSIKAIDALRMASYSRISHIQEIISEANHCIFPTEYWENELREIENALMELKDLEGQCK
jgi:hypothetical protein